MESESCLITIAIGVVVTIILITLGILIRDIVKFVYKRMRTSSSSKSSLPRPGPYNQEKPK